MIDKHGEEYPEPDNETQYLGEAQDYDHVADYLRKLKERTPYYLLEDTLTRQVVIVFPMRKPDHGGIMVWTQADGYREFSDEGMKRFGPVRTLKLRVAVVEGALKVAGDTPQYRKHRSEV